VSYYTATVAAGVEDYYAGRGEAEGRWLGWGSAAAGLAGEADGEQLARLFDARHPRTGEPLGASYRVREGADRVTGWDLTFSAPKSASVLWAIGGGAIGLEVRDAHDAAVLTALAYLEEHAAFSRTGKAGVRQVDTEGLLAAGFVHRTSRSGDPQLHTHVLVSGRVRCSSDGAWRALDSKALHRQLKPAGMLYQAALRAELTTRLGVEWGEANRHGQAEILGVPTGVRRLFSARRAAVEAAASQRVAEREEALGRSLTAAERRRAFEVAVLETRAAKTFGSETDLGLHDWWALEAAAAGFDPVSWLPDTLGGRRSPAVRVADPSQLDVVVAELASASSTFTRADAVKVAARHAPVGLTDAEAVRHWVDDTARRALAGSGVVCLAAPEPETPAELHRRDGGSVYGRHDAARYTTTTTLRIEQQILDLVAAGRQVGVAVADDRDTARAVTLAGLDGEQAAAVSAITGGGERVSVLVGPAGTGKTRTMAAAASAWEGSAVPVRGVAVSAIAAGVLAAEAGVPADTIAKLLAEHDRPQGPAPGWVLQSGEVVVIDEAGMVASADLARLLTLIEQADGKAVLVGDPAQLGPVQAGGLFRLLAVDATAELTHAHRFTQDWEQHASLRLRRGDPTVVGDYDDHGRVLGGDRQLVLDEAVARWHDARYRGETVVITAADHATVNELAERIRAGRVAAGEVQPKGVLTAAGQTVGVGDEIVSLRNDRSLVTSRGLWVRNGDRWTVTGIAPDQSVTVSHHAGHGQVVLPAGYAAEQVALAYAVTVHKAQGVTVDAAVAVVDEHTRAEGLYVAMTRGRSSNVALAVTDNDDPDRHHRPPEPRTALDVLTAAMARTGTELSATETLRRELARSESLAVLAPRLANLQMQIRRDCPPDRSIDLARLANQRAQLEQHLRPGRLTTAGRHARRTLADLDGRCDQLEAAQRTRDTWLAEHAELFSYRNQLTDAVADRRHQLGAHALATQPEHLVELLGPVPDQPAGAEDWASRAARIEAYREQWSVPADRLHEIPVDGVQHTEWSNTVRLEGDCQRLATRSAARSHRIEHDFGIEL